MLKKDFLFLFVLFIYFNGLSQEENTIPLIDQISVPTPTVGAIQKYGEIDVNLSNGLPNISVPIYNASTSNISHPISLSYHSGGVKVDEQSTWVGQNWSLIAGGSISRTVRGHADDTFFGILDPVQAGNAEDFISYLNGLNSYPANEIQAFHSWSNFGMFNSSGFDNVIDLSAYDLYSISANGDTIPLVPYGLSGMSAQNPSTGNPNIDQLIYPYNLAQGKRDGQSDIYSFNVNGYSGKFHFDLSGGIVFQSTQNIEFEYFRENGGIGLIYKWHVKTPDGFSYEFGSSTHETGATDYSTNSSELSPPHATAWHLTKIISPFEDELRFYYQSYSMSNNYTSSTTMYEKISGLGVFSKPDNVQSSFGITQGHYLEKIEWDEGKIEMSLSNETAHGLGGKKLDEIQIYNSEDELIRKFELNYLDQGSRRWLESVQEFAGSESIPPYQFEYLNIGLVVPPNSAKQDHWGYQNSNSSSSLVPSFMPWTSAEMLFGQANRNTDPIQQLNGSMQKITYPTGGYTEFDFESNDYSWTGSSGTILDEQEFFSVHDEHNNTYWYEQALPFEEVKTFTLNTSGEIRVSYEIDLDEDEQLPGEGGEGQFEIKNTGTGEIVFSKNYGDEQFEDYEYITLIAGDYEIKNSVLLPGDIVKVNVYFREFIGATNIISVGGLRINEIRSYDGINTEPALKKKYEYKDGSKSSGILLNKPNYHFFIFRINYT